MRGFTSGLFLVVVSHCRCVVPALLTCGACLAYLVVGRAVLLNKTEKNYLSTPSLNIRNLHIKSTTRAPWCLCMLTWSIMLEARPATYGSPAEGDGRLFRKADRLFVCLFVLRARVRCSLDPAAERYLQQVLSWRGGARTAGGGAAVSAARFFCAASPRTETLGASL